MSGKRYDVMSPRPKKDGGTFWTRVGMAFQGDKGISIEFSALPLPDKEGRVRVSLFEPREQSQASGRRPAMVSDGIEDEVPF